MDKLTNEQLQAVMHKEGNILVSASAGSGKTHVMIQRIIRLILEKKASADSILAVTFTTDAAAEMKEKLKLALTDKAESGGAYIKEQLKLLAYSDISTIHSFCANLLRSYFFQAGIGAGFEILDEKEADLLKNEAVSRLFTAHYKNRTPWFMTLTAEFSKNRRDVFLRNLLISVYKKTVSRKEPIAALKRAQALYSGQGFEKILEDILLNFHQTLKIFAGDFYAFYKTCTNLTPNNLACSDEIIRLLEQKLHAHSFDVYFEPQNLSLSSRLYRPKEEEQQSGFETLKLLRDALKALLKNEEAFAKDFDRGKELDIFLKSGETSERLLSLIQEFSALYQTLKEEENKLDYDDLLHKTAALLQNQEILSNIKKRYTHIFTDEYQDVNDVQEEILSLISNDNMFMVGDLKQSIYAFRGCNPDFFARKFDEFSGGKGRAVSLNSNFRSSGAVIDGVNKIFSRAMTAALAGIDYKNRSMLIRGGLYPEGCGSAVLHVLEKEDAPAPGKNLGVYDILSEITKAKDEQTDAESLLVAKIAAEAVGKDYFDIKEQKTKQVNFSDIAVLARNRTGFSKITAALNALGIPCLSDAKDNILNYPEVKLIILIMEFIDSGEQDIPLACALKHLGGLTDAELAALRLSAQSGSFCGYCRDYAKNNGDGISRKITALYEYADKLRLLADFEGAADVLNRAFLEKGVYSKIETLPFGALRIKRMARFLKESQTSYGQLTVREFLRRIKGYTSPLTLSVSDAEDAVKLMTVHASKGLEYPVVIMSGASKTFILEDEKKEVYTDPVYGLAAKCYDLKNKTVSETVLRKLIRLNMRGTMAQDEMRLFYVALTRAKYALHIVSEKPPAAAASAYSIKTALSFSDFLVLNELKTISYTHRDLENGAVKSVPEQILVGKGDDTLTAGIKKRLGYVYPYQSAIYLPVKSSVTALIKRDAPGKMFYISEAAESDAEKGTLYHRFLQHAEFGRTDGETMLGEMVDSGIFSKDEAALLNVSQLNGILQIPELAALSGKTLLKEQEFIAPFAAKDVLDTDSTDEIIVQGVIDLAAVQDGAAHIYDYKYSALSDASLTAKYARQLRLYAQAYTKITKRRVKALKIINILTLSVINIPL